LHTGGHIRVLIVLNQLPKRLRWAIEGLCLLAAAAVTSFVAYVMVRLVYQSFLLGDVSQATDASPLWIVQLPTALGSILLAVAFLDALISHFMFKITTIPAQGEDCSTE